LFPSNKGGGSPLSHCPSSGGNNRASAKLCCRCAMIRSAKYLCMYKKLWTSSKNYSCSLDGAEQHEINHQSSKTPMLSRQMFKKIVSKQRMLASNVFRWIASMYVGDQRCYTLRQICMNKHRQLLQALFAGVSRGTRLAYVITQQHTCALGCWGVHGRRGNQSD
jgi:hypothetical protein